MRFSLDDFQRAIALRLSPGAPETKQLDEHQNLLERGSKLVRDVGQKSLARVYEAHLAAEGGEACDCEDDASREQQHRGGKGRLLNTAGNEKAGHIRPERAPE